MTKFKLEKLAAVFFFIATFLYFISPVLDVDFPWHLKTGEYIFQHMEIPKVDPFSISTSGGPAERFVMTQYWLAQVLFYLVYQLAGTLGIIVLRSLVFTGIIALVWYSMKNTPIMLKAGVLYGTVILLHFYSNDRPQFFSFLFAAVVVALLMQHSRTHSIKSLIFLPAIMLIWANLHGGFIFGDVAIAVYCLCETLKFFFMRRPAQYASGGKLLMLLSIGLLSVLVSFINPNGYYAFTFSMNSLSGSSRIREYVSPLAETRGAYVSRYDFIYWAVVGYSLIVLAFNLKRSDLTHIALMAFVLSLSLSASRFVPFFAIAGLIVSGQYRLPLGWFDRRQFFNKLKIPLTAGVALAVLLWGGSLAYSRAPVPTLRVMPETVFFPERAAKFLLRHMEGERLFNSRNCGSYFLWRLYPKFRTLIDTRGLDARVVKDYSRIAFASRYDGDKSAYVNALNALLPESPPKGKIPSGEAHAVPPEHELWKELLRKYDINVIVHEATNFFSGIIYPLTLRLIHDDDWKLIYADGKVMIFVRDIPHFRELIGHYGLDKKRIYDEIGTETARQIGKSLHAAVYSSVAFALTMKNGSEKAVKKYMDFARYLDPGDQQTALIGAFIERRRQKG